MLWTEYKVGDISLFFLDLKNGRYPSMGGGNEGELPIYNAKIYVHASTISKMGFVGQFDRSDLQMKDNGYNNPYNGYVMDLNDFWQAVAIIKKCFKSEISKTGDLLNIQQDCATSDYESTMKENNILNWAISELIS